MQVASLSNHEVRNVELDMLLPGGTRRNMLGSTSPLRDYEGRVRGCIGAFMDITERKRAEEERERLLARVQQQATVLSGINRIFQEAFGAGTEEELGRCFLTVAEEVTGSVFGFIGELNAEGRMDDLAMSDPGWGECR